MINPKVFFCMLLAMCFPILDAQYESIGNTNQYLKSEPFETYLNLQYTLYQGSNLSGLNVDRVGTIISCLGDINGDGFDDWAVGLSTAADYITGIYTGAVHIYFGSGTRRTSESPADLVMRGGPGEGFGTNVKAAGDVNADGYDDMLVYLFDWNDNRTLFTPTWALYYGGSPFDTLADVLFTKLDQHAGNANFASHAGDLNNDGFDDVLLSVPTQIGKLDTAHVYMYYGGVNMDNNPDIIFVGRVDPIDPQTGSGGADNFTGATAAGDVDKDGFDDIIISCSEGAKLYLGGLNMNIDHDVLFDDFRGAGIGAGPSVKSAGDVNNDGYDDVLLTASIVNTKAFIFYGGETVDNIPDVEIPIWTKETYFGFSSVGEGDVNKDGFDDVLLGTSTLWSIDTGAAKVFFGGNNMDSIADIEIFGPEPYKNFGYACAGGGDFDGDGYDDFLVGDVGDAASFDQTDDAGSISLFYGGESISDTADAIFSGIADNEGFGSSVAHAGDVNKDGYPDLIVGASSHYDRYYSGRAYLYYGGETLNSTADLIFDTPTPYDGANRYFGKKVQSAGDINGDGFSDIYIEEAYRVFIYLGGLEMDNVADYTFHSPTNTYSFAALGDVNKDGNDDVLFGDTKKGTGGTAWLYFGGENIMDGADYTFTGTTAGDNLGSRCSGAGDLNKDGYMDFMISIPGEDDYASNAGAVSIFFGGTDISSTGELIINGQYKDQGFGGRDITGDGDINNDGFSDIVISDYLFSLTPASYEGRISIYYGGLEMDGNADAIFTGDTINRRLGKRSLIIPDINGDGFDEILSDGINDETGYMAASIYLGSDTIDSLPDIILPYTMDNAFGTYIADPDSFVYFMVGDPSNSAAGPSSGRVIVYTTKAIDNLAPKVLSEMTAPSDTTLLLQFDESVNTETAEVAGNYILSGTSGFTGNVKQAVLINLTTVLLTIERFSALGGKNIIITVSNVEDLNGNRIDPVYNSASYTVAELFPVVVADAQNITNEASQIVIAQSNLVSGYVYIILDGETQSTMADLDAAVAAGKAAKAPVTSAFTNTEIIVSGITPGTYYAYATDDTGRISLKGINPILIAQSTTAVAGIVDSYLNVYSQMRKVIIESTSYVLDRVAIYNLTGQTVVNQKINSDRHEIIMEKGGIYFVKLVSNKYGIRTFKLVVQ